MLIKRLFSKTTKNDSISFKFCTEKNASRCVTKYGEYDLCPSDGKCHGLSKPAGDLTLPRDPLVYFSFLADICLCVYIFHLVALFRHVPLSFKHFSGNICWLRFVAPDCLLKFAMIRVPSQAHKPYSAYLYSLRTYRIYYRFIKHRAFV